MANGGSFCVGAIAFNADTFSNDCTTSTKTLKYNAAQALITYVLRQASCNRYRATTVIASTASEIMPSLMAGVPPAKGNRKPVMLVSAVLIRNTAVQPLSRLFVRKP